MTGGYLNCRKAASRLRSRTVVLESGSGVPSTSAQRNQTEKRKVHPCANLKHWRREDPHKMAVRLARRRTSNLIAEGDFTVERLEVLCEK